MNNQPTRDDAPQLDATRQLMAAAHGAVQASLAINGAGAVALLALIGYLNDRSYHLPLAQLALPLYLFLLGVFAGAVSFGVAYVAQRFVVDGRIRATHYWNAVTVALLFASYLCFLLAAHFLYRVISRGIAA
jgi:uncharacterized membrane protein YvlD (DUF360 family)